MGRRPGARHGHGSDLAGHARGPGALRAGKVVGVRLLDQGVDQQGRPDDGFMPGMDIHAALTVVGDGPVGPVGRQLDDAFGLPAGPSRAGMGRGHEVRGGPAGKHVARTRHGAAHVRFSGTGDFRIPLRAPRTGRFAGHFRAVLVRQPGPHGPTAIFNTGFCILISGAICRAAGCAPGAPKRWANPAGAANLTWSATASRESAKAAAGRTCSPAPGVDEAWTTGTQLAEAVLELLKAKRPFTKENLEATYVKRRRASWVEKEAHVAEHARDGFQQRRRTRHVRLGAGGVERTAGFRCAATRCRRGSGFRRSRRITAAASPPTKSRRIRDECYAHGISAACRADGTRGLAGHSL